MDIATDFGPIIAGFAGGWIVESSRFKVQGSKFKDPLSLSLGRMFPTRPTDYIRVVVSLRERGPFDQHWGIRWLGLA
jgi:hypothetical protein